MAVGVPGRLRPQIFSTFGTEAESTSGHMVLSEGTTEKKSHVTPPGIDPGTVRLVAQRLNHYPSQGPMQMYTKIQIVAYHTLYIFFIVVSRQIL